MPDLSEGALRLLSAMTTADRIVMHVTVDGWGTSAEYRMSGRVVPSGHAKELIRENRIVLDRGAEGTQYGLRPEAASILQGEVRA